MEKFRIVLTDAQTDVVLPYIEMAEKYCDEYDKFGAVFCQAMRDYREGQIRIVGNFVPEEYALRIDEIFEEWQDEMSKVRDQT